VAWSDLVQQGFMGISGINPRRRHIPTGVSYTLAARLTGQPTADTKADKGKDAEKKKDEKPAPAAKINVIAIADLDMIGEQFFQMRQRKIEDLEFDNVPFVLNCVDVLAGDESFVGLRGKHPKHRRLDLIEDRLKVFDKQLAQKTKEAEDEASTQMLTAQSAFDKEVDAVKNRSEWDERTKEIQLAQLQTVAQRRLDVQKRIIEDGKLVEIREAKAESERQIRSIRNWVRVEAAAIPPLPPLILGLVVWISRLRRENLGANPKRLV
jgi:ABC-2 type transport system permease protein